MKKNTDTTSEQENHLSLKVLDRFDLIFLEDRFKNSHFSYQSKKQIIEIANYLFAWNEGSIKRIWPSELTHPKALLKELRKRFDLIKDKEIEYHSNTNQDNSSNNIERPNIQISYNQNKIWGECPVSSNRTRCCKLITLDAVSQCAFACSYCSIQAFYKNCQLSLDGNLNSKLNEFEKSMNPDLIYHIGTGQSSDSLFIGDYNGVLNTLFQFAKRNPNIILELKSKSKEIDYILNNYVPKNIIITWSLNPQTIIDNEEHLTASLMDRLDAAKKVAQKGVLIGFHFHPMIKYKNWQNEYLEISNFIQKNFSAGQIALISMGTLTFSERTLKLIKQQSIKSKILQMPLVEVEGKFSYPENIKIEMFSLLYNSFFKWFDQVFFYLCMEPHSVWQKVFGKTVDYSSNEDFETAMKNAYMKKITSLTSIN